MSWSGRRRRVGGEVRDEAVAQRRHRGRRGEDGQRPGRARDGVVPAREGEREQPLAEEEAGPVGEHDRAVGGYGGPSAVRRSVQAGRATALRRQPPVQIAGPEGLAQRGRDGFPVGEVGRVPALAARAVAGRERHGVVEEEERRPAPRPGETDAPPSERRADR